MKLLLKNDPSPTICNLQIKKKILNLKKTSNFEESFDSLLIGPGPLLTDYKFPFTAKLHNKMFLIFCFCGLGVNRVTRR